MRNKERYVWVALRIAMGWLHLWAFLDKLLGLGYATAPEDAWIAGGAPTSGYLEFAVSGPLGVLFNRLAGSPVVDWIFMLGLLFIGLALLLGIGVRTAGYSGALMMLLLWMSRLPPENNPILDEHIVYALVLIGLANVKAGQWLGLGKWWSQRMKNYPILQ